MLKNLASWGFMASGPIPFVLLVVLGLSPTQALWATLVLSGAALSGLSLTTALLEPRVGPLESLALAIPLGALLQALSFLVIGPAFDARLILVMTLVISSTPWLSQTRRYRLGRMRVPWGVSIRMIALGTVTAGIGALSFLLRHRLNWSGPLDINDDIVYHEALMGAAQGGWPVHSPLLGQEPLSYHWLPHLWAAFADSVANLPPFASITRVLPLLAISGVLVAAVAWAKRLSPHRCAAPAAVVGITTVGVIAKGPQIGQPLPLESPSEVFGSMFMLVICLAVWMFRQGDLSRLAYAIVLLVGFFGLTGAKLSQAVVTLCAIGALAIGSHVRELRHRDLRVHSVGLVGFSLGFIVFHFRGDRHDLSFHPLESLTTGLKAVFNLSPSVPSALLTVAAIVAPLLISLRVLRRNSDLRVFVLGAVGSGTFLKLTITSPGGSEGWFLAAALKIVIVVAAVGLASVIDDLRPRNVVPLWKAVLSALIGLGCTMMVTVSYFFDVGLPSTTALRLITLLTGASLAGLVFLRRPSWWGVTAGLFLVASLSTVLDSSILAAGNIRLESEEHTFDAVRSEAFVIGAELHDASAPNDLLVTNRFCRDARETWPGCNTKWFEASAASGRRSLIEGIDYAVGTSPPREILRLVELSERAAGTADPVALSEVYELGVRWIWFDRLISQQPDWGHFGNVRFSNDLIVIIELSPTLATAAQRRGE